MSGIPRMGKIGLKNEKYNKAFEKHIKQSNTLASLTEKKCSTAKCSKQQEFYLLHSKKKSRRALKQIEEKIVTRKKMFFGKYKKEMIDGYCEKYRYTNPQ